MCKPSLPKVFTLLGLWLLVFAFGCGSGGAPTEEDMTPIPASHSAHSAQQSKQKTRPKSSDAIVKPAEK